MASENYPDQKGRTISITRTFDAPRDLVFEALVTPEHMKRWHHAGEGWTTPWAETDPRPGGKLRVAYGSPDGKEDFVLEATYKAVDRPRRIVYELADGRTVTTTLEESGGKTTVTVELALETEYHEDLQRQGWSEHLENLGKHLANLAKK